MVAVYPRIPAVFDTHGDSMTSIFGQGCATVGEMVEESSNSMGALFNRYGPSRLANSLAPAEICSMACTPDHSLTYVIHCVLYSTNKDDPDLWMPGCLDGQAWTFTTPAIRTCTTSKTQVMQLEC